MAFQCLILACSLQDKNRDEIKTHSYLIEVRTLSLDIVVHNYRVLLDDTCAHYRTRFGTESAIGPYEPHPSTPYGTICQHRAVSPQSSNFRTYSGNENVGFRNSDNANLHSRLGFFTVALGRQQETDASFDANSSSPSDLLSFSSQLHTTRFPFLIVIHVIHKVSILSKL